MAELTREIVHDRRGASSVIAWLALILAIAALALAWLAYNRSGLDLENRIQSQVNESLNEAQQETQEVQNDIQEEGDRNTTNDNNPQTNDLQ